jgi:hypothetical protein
MQHTSTFTTRWHSTFVIGITLLGLLICVPMPIHADTSYPHHAGLVVRYGNGSVTTRCVDLGEDGQASGEEVLRASGLAVTAEYSSMGAAICKIENDGCSYPAEGCFCQCTLQPGQTCVYWSYWHLKNNQWQYSQFGTTNYTVHSGEVDGWSWGAGTTSNAVAPPMYTFNDICAPASTNTPMPTGTPTSTSAGAIMSTVVILTAAPTSAPPTSTATPIPATSVSATATPIPSTSTPQAQASPTPVPPPSPTTTPPGNTPAPTPIQPGVETATPMTIAAAEAADTSVQQQTGRLYLPFVRQAGTAPDAANVLPAATDTPVPPTTPGNTPATPSEQPIATPMPTAGPLTGTNAENNPAGYVLFGAVTAGLAGTLLILRLRRH